jgi:hypothetical protein
MNRIAALLYLLAAISVLLMTESQAFIFPMVLFIILGSVFLGKDIE